MSNVHRLPDSGFSRSNADTARLLRDLADRIEDGEFGHVPNIVSIIETEAGELERITYGGPIDRARVVGLLTMAIHRASCNAAPEG